MRRHRGVFAGEPVPLHKKNDNAEAQRALRFAENAAFGSIARDGVENQRISPQRSRRPQR